MNAQILAESSPGEVRAAALAGGVLIDYAIWRPDAPDGVGDLHRGRITARVPALGGAFVALENGEGFLPDTEGAASIPEGTVLGVRVTRAAQGGKGARLSAKLTAEETGRIGSGRPALVDRGPSALERLASIHPEAVVFASDPDLVARLRPVLRDRVQRARAPVWDETLASEIAGLSEPSAPLPSGGRMSVHPTPALTAIDLDAGTASADRAGKTRSQVAFNAAALPELARQIRLRNLGGAILVDWAGLSAKRRAALGAALALALAPDPVRPRLLGFTALGLAEIVRPRVHPPLHELLSGPHAAALAGLRALAAETAADPARRRALRASPALAAVLAGSAVARADVVRLTGHELLVRSDPGLSRDAWQVELAHE